jgi:pSer/pThr/pTyr-binding forkhead associated (FHA) protein
VVEGGANKKKSEPPGRGRGSAPIPKARAWEEPAKKTEPSGPEDMLGGVADPEPVDTGDLVIDERDERGRPSRVSSAMPPRPKPAPKRPKASTPPALPGADDRPPPTNAEPVRSGGMRRSSSRRDADAPNMEKLKEELSASENAARRNRERLSEFSREDWPAEPSPRDRGRREERERDRELDRDRPPDRERARESERERPSDRDRVRESKRDRARELDRDRSRQSDRPWEREDQGDPPRAADDQEILSTKPPRGAGRSPADRALEKQVVVRPKAEARGESARPRARARSAGKAPDTAEPTPFPDQGNEAFQPENFLEPPGAAARPKENRPARRSARPSRKGPQVDALVGRLVVVDGQAMGQVFLLYPGEYVLGRSEGADLILADDAVSRKHISLQVDPSRVVLRDLGSGNGTRVNGRKVSDAQLGHGDRVNLGRHQLRYEVAGSENVQTSPSMVVQGGGWRRARKKVLWVALAGLAMGVIAGGKPALQYWKRRQAAIEEKERAGALKAVADTKYQAGIEARDAGRFADAVVLFEAAKALLPLPEYTTALVEARREHSDGQKLSRAKEHQKGARLSEARALLMEIKNESRTYPKAQETLAEINRVEVGMLRTQAEVAEREGRLAEARLAYQKLKDLLPSDAAVANALARLATLAAGKADAAVKEPARPAKAKEKEKPREKVAGDGGKGVVSAALAKFDEGRVGDAIAMLDRGMESLSAGERDRAGKLQNQMAAFSAAWERGSEAVKGKDGPTAAKELDKAYRLAREIHGDGPISADVKVELSKAYYLAGNFAYEAKPRQLKRAKINYQLSLKNDPEGKAAQYSKQMLVAIEQHAQRLLDGIQAVKDPDARANQLREVMDLSEPGSPLYRKAQAALDAVPSAPPRGAEDEQVVDEEGAED